MANTIYTPERLSELSKHNCLMMPIGGCGQFGMNMTCFLYQDEMIAVDVGGQFGEPWMPGVSLIIPSAEQDLFKAFPLKSIIITHGHEDHIGALPHFYKQLDHKPPIFASKWTADLIRRKCERFQVDADIFTVDANDVVKEGPFQIKFVPTPHSIPDACSLLIKTDRAKIFHTGDFKLDIQENDSCPPSLENVKDESIDFLLCDSTNAHKSGFTPSEDVVTNALYKHIKEAEGNVYITTFSSNIERFKNVSDICKRLNKKLFLSGISVRENYEAAKRFKFIKHDYFDEADAQETSGNYVVLISGCQGEHRAALSRLANDEHRFFKLGTKDLVIFSARTIPGCEVNISKLTDKLLRLGANILTPTQDPLIHTSGHAFRGDIDALLGTLKPKHFIPIHGNYQQLLRNKEGSHGYDTHFIENGQVLVCDADHPQVQDGTPVLVDYIDDASKQRFEKSVLLERLRISKRGVAILVGAYSPAQKSWVLPLRMDILGLNNKGEAFDVWSEKTLKSLSKLAKKPNILPSDLESKWREALFSFYNVKPVCKFHVGFLDAMDH